MAPPSAPPKLVSLLLLTIVAAISMNVMSVGATWCVARSDASYQALIRGLNYACGAGADCRPIQPGGICFYPNTIQNHASYAYDSYYQRRGRAPGTCVFGGTATIAVTDPSYGRCIYPSFQSCIYPTAEMQLQRTSPQERIRAQIFLTLSFMSTVLTAGGAYTPITTPPTNNPNVTSFSPNMNESSMDKFEAR